MVIEEALLDDIRRVTAFAKDHEAEFLEMVTSKTKVALDRSLRENKRELEQATQRIRKLNEIIQRLYEDNLEGKISDDRFAKMTANYEAEQHSLEQRVAELRTAISAEKQNNDTNKAFIPGEKKYPCKITNISGGGCCLSTKFPIKEGQYLFLTMPFINDKNTVLGKIVKTRNSMQEGLFNLHIHFEKIPLEIINKIQAEAHNFENSFQK